MAVPIFPNDKTLRSLSDFEFVHEPADKNSKLGAGSFATVKLAKEKQTGKQHAIKIIALEPSKMTDSDLYSIRTEIAIHKKLDHPNIVKFHEYIQKDYNVYLVLEYAESGNLYSYIHKRKGLSNDEIFRFFHQTVLAFQYLHQNDVLHRDLKPENLLLDKNHNIKLCDFGWATRRITEKRLTFCGTYEYMAPEIVFKKPYDYRVDIWALGILLYELIHREAPYKGRSLQDITKSLSKPQINFSSSINPEAKDLILKILRTDPNERLSMAQILAHPWVQSHLSHKEDDKVQMPEVLVSPREVRPVCLQIVHEESSKTNPRREREFFKSEILDRTKERELKEKGKLFNNPNVNILNHSEVQRRSPAADFGYTNLSGVRNDNPLSARGHNKSSSTVNNLMEKSDLIEIKDLKDIRKRKILESTMLSPNFKTKMNTVINQLSSNTTTHRTAESVSLLFSPKVPNQNQQQTSQAPSSEVPLGYRCYNENTQTSSQNIKNKALAKVSVSDKVVNYIPSTTPSSTSNFKLKMSSESTKIGDQRKNSIQKKLSFPRGENSPTIPSPLLTRNLTSRHKLDRNLETPSQESNFVFPTKYSKMEPSKPVNKKDFESILGIAEQNKYRTQNRSETNDSISKIYKALDYKRIHDLKISEDLSLINLQLSTLSTRRNANKENKKDILREKEAQIKLRDENVGKWAF